MMVVQIEVMMVVVVCSDVNGSSDLGGGGGVDGSRVDGGCGNFLLR